MNTKKEVSDQKEPEVLVRVGKKIPDCEFQVFQEGGVQTIRFSDYENDKWVILFFYPADFTFVCPTELEELAECYRECADLDTEIISVSTDTVFTHKAWYDASPSIHKIKFPMAADPSGRLARLFHSYIEPNGGEEYTEDEGLALRATFIIDPDGILRAMEMNDNAIGRSAKELIRKLQAAQFVRKHGGQVCPASWEEGKDTLEPGMDLVGKI